MTKVLVTGANGFLGQHLCNFLQLAGFIVVASSRGSCRLAKNPAIQYHAAELTSPKEVQSMIAEHKPDFVIHTAAMSKPDECENQRERCLEVNVGATEHLVRYTKGHFIYISTDFIFGENGPHDETTIPDPLNFYGETKLMAENVVKKSGLNYSIVRPVFIYGRQLEGSRPSFLHWVKNSLEQDKRIKVVSDQLRTPTYVDDICSGIVSIIRRSALGDFHLAGKDFISPYEMAVTTASVLGLDGSLIENVTSETFHEPVRRSKRSGLNIDKAIKELGYAPVSFEEGVRLTFGL